MHQYYFGYEYLINDWIIAQSWSYGISKWNKNNIPCTKTNFRITKMNDDSIDVALPILSLNEYEEMYFRLTE